MNRPASAAFRARARRSLGNQWGRNAGFLLLYYIIVEIASLILRAIPVAGDIVLFVCSGALSLGLYDYYLELARRRKPAFPVFFSGFNQFVHSFILYLLMWIFVALWTLLLVVPGIIAYYRYSQAYFILKDNPELSPLEAINASKIMMAGNKGRLFLLHLSFVGWFILGLATFGIGYLWIIPYALTAISHFYDDLKYRGQQGPPPPPGSFGFAL